MSDENEDTGHHPSTFKAVRTHADGIAWDDHATVHRTDGGDGLFDSFKALHRGTLAEMVALVSRMPEDQRADYVIQKSGDQKLGADTIMEMSRRDDFPLKV